MVADAVHAKAVSQEAAFFFSALSAGCLSPTLKLHLQGFLIFGLSMKNASSYNQRRQEAVDQLLQVLQHLYPLTPAIQEYFREKVFLSFYDRGALVVE